MIAAIALLLVCQLTGEAIHRLTGAPLPGPVLGMFLLFGWLAVSRRERPHLDAVANWLLAHLSIMFVPAAVGVIGQGPALARYGWALGVAIVVSTLASLTVAALVFRLVAGRAERAEA